MMAAQADVATLLDGLPPVWRMALAYAPGAAREQWLSLMALDVRLAGVVRGAREPMIGQMKLAWWRDRLGAEPAGWPKGEPLLAALRAWDEPHRLIALVDGWETLLAEWDGGAALVAGRVQAMVALCAALDADDAGVAELAAHWAWADLAAHLGDADERHAALAHVPAGKAPRVAKAMRPLVVMQGMASHVARGGNPAAFSAFVRAIRLGIFGT